MRVEVRWNNTPLTSGEAYCIQGLVKNSQNAKAVSVPMASFSPVGLSGAKLSMRVSARIGTNGWGRFCGGRTNADGLRVYFDAANRASQLAGSATP